MFKPTGATSFLLVWQVTGVYEDSLGDAWIFFDQESRQARNVQANIIS
jgi:hypothetical protein